MRIDQQFTKFNDLLFKAIPAIKGKYMTFESVGLMDGFMERTYAYEFYHQLRKFQDELNYNDFTIHAEPQKARTKFLHRILERLEEERLENEHIDDFQKRVMPDLLVHVPDNLNENVAIVEIKPDKGLSWDRKGIKKDIRVLKEFVSGGNDDDGYYKGILLLYSTSNGFNDAEIIKKNYSEIIKDTLGNNWYDYSQKIDLLWHHKVGTQPKNITWE